MVTLPVVVIPYTFAHVTTNGAALFSFGAAPDPVKLTELLTALPLLGAVFRGEHAARLARGEAEVARATGRHANDLAHALDAARGEVERALAESARLNAELQETDRRKDDFMAMLGHELRNPMAAISGAIEVMRACPDDLEQTARARAVIERRPCAAVLQRQVGIVVHAETERAFRSTGCAVLILGQHARDIHSRELGDGRRR